MNRYTKSDKPFKHNYRSRKGVVTVELAVILPVLVVLLGGAGTLLWGIGVHGACMNVATITASQLANGATPAQAQAVAERIAEPLGITVTIGTDVTATRDVGFMGRTVHVSATAGLPLDKGTE